MNLNFILIIGQEHFDFGLISSLEEYFYFRFFIKVGEYTSPTDSLTSSQPTYIARNHPEEISIVDFTIRAYQNPASITTHNNPTSRERKLVSYLCFLQVFIKQPLWRHDVLTPQMIHRPHRLLVVQS